MTEIESYADYPKSINELKLSDSSFDWTTRETLIHLLRKIDNKEITLDKVVICYKMTEKGAESSPIQYLASNVTMTDALGMMEICKYMMLSRRDDR